MSIKFMLFSIAFSLPLSAQAVPKMFDVLSESKSETDLLISEPGIIRLQLSKTDEPWHLFYIDPIGKTISVSDDNFSRYRVYGDTIEIPVSTGGNAHLKMTGSLTRVFWESYEPVSIGSPLYSQGGFLEPINAEFKNNPKNEKFVNLSAAVVRVHWATTLRGEWCNGVQIQPGIILTNRHCLPTNYNIQAPIGEVTVQFGEFKNSLEDFVEAIPAEVMIAPTKNKTDIHYQPDLAVLRLKNTPKLDRYRNAIAPLDLTTTPQRHTMLITIWSQPLRPGKSISRDPKCNSDLSIKATRYCEKDIAFIHQCETEETSSGSPIFNLDNEKLIGLHYFGVAANVGNCAIRVEKIRETINGLLREMEK